MILDILAGTVLWVVLTVTLGAFLTGSFSSFYDVIKNSLLFQIIAIGVSAVVFSIGWSIYRVFGWW